MADQLPFGGIEPEPTLCGETQKGLHACPLPADHPGEHIFWSWSKTDADVARPYTIRTHQMDAEGRLVDTVAAKWRSKPDDEAVGELFASLAAGYERLLNHE